MYEDPFFLRKKPNVTKLLDYGFTKESDGYRYAAAVMDGQFRLEVFVAADGTVSTRMTDSGSQEEYTLYKVPSSVGAFVGAVRSACEAVLTDIAKTCFDPAVFQQEQTYALIDYVGKTYGDELEFLWDKFPDCAVWRRQDSQKWYAAILTVSRRKLGLPSDEVVEIIDLRLPPEQMAQTVDRKRYFPGWHMNKKTWYTIILDSSVPTAEICRRLDESYRLAIK